MSSKFAHITQPQKSQVVPFAALKQTLTKIYYWLKLRLLKILPSTKEKRLTPFYFDEHGNKIFDITGIKYASLITKKDEAGAIVIDGHKRYTIQPDGSLLRTDKKRKRK